MRAYINEASRKKKGRLIKEIIEKVEAGSLEFQTMRNVLGHSPKQLLGESCRPQYFYYISLCVLEYWGL